MTFAWPWLLVLTPLYWLLPKRNVSASAALDHPYLMSLGQTTQTHGKKNSVRTILWLIAWMFIVIALMRPQWVSEPVANKLSGRSILLSVDLSTSMLEKDMRWNGRPIERYQAVQAIVGEFVNQRQGDFIGLVVFGSFADIQSPLTPDTQAVKDILEDLRPGMAGQSTAIGDGLALAVKQLRESDSPDKVIILLSDGENKTGNVTPEQATQAAQKSDIKVYTIGFGSSQMNGLGGLFSSMSSSIDETALKNIANQTNGQYFRASTTDDLFQVFNTIDKLEASDRDDRELRLITELYWAPLSVCFCIVLFNLLLPLFTRGKIS